MMSEKVVFIDYDKYSTSLLIIKLINQMSPKTKMR